MIIITSSKYSNLGNKLLQFAAFIAFSEKHKIRIVNPSFSLHAEHFETTSQDFYCRYPAEKSFLRSHVARMIMRAVMFRSALLLKKLGRRKNIEVVDIGWDIQCQLNDPDFIARAKNTKYLFAMGWNFNIVINDERINEKIRTFFVPLKKYRDPIAELFRTKRKEDVIIAGIHIRHGDYKTFEGGRYYYNIDQYVHVMKRFLSLFEGKQVRFMICSNELQPAEKFNGFDFFFGPGSQIEDMYSFAECDYILGPPSTYTMWASFYGKKPLFMVHDPKEEFQLSDFKVYDLSRE